jgi:hypothetical protein
MYKRPRKSIVIIFFLISLIKSQTVPSFIENKTDLDNFEEVIEAIYSIRESGIDIKELSLRDLKSIFFFIEDSILRNYKSNQENLSLEMKQFFYSFEDQQEIDSYTILRKSLNETVQDDQKIGNNLIIKEYLNIKHMNLTLSFRSLKLKNETYFSHQYFSMIYKIERFSITIGDQKVNGSNPLILSSPYGKNYYEFQNLNYPHMNYFSSQNSIDRQNQFRAISLHYKINQDLQFTSMFGLQNHLVTFHDDHFKSFNFYFPETDQTAIRNKKKVNEQLLFNELTWSITSNHNLNIQLLNSKLTDKFKMKNDFNNIELKNTTHLGLNYQGEFNEHQIRFLGAFDLKSFASEFHYQNLSKNNKFTFSYFNYSMDFLNYHGTSLFSGKKMPNNEHGILIQNWYKFQAFETEFSYMKREDLIDETVKDKNSEKEFLQFIISTSFNKINLSFKYRESSNKKIEFKALKKFAKSEIYFKNINFIKDGSSYSNVKYSFSDFHTSIAYANVNSGFSTYRYGIYREFLTKYFKENTIHFSISKKHSISDKFSFYFIYDLFKSSEKSEHDIAMALKLNF